MSADIPKVFPTLTDAKLSLHGSLLGGGAATINRDGAEVTIELPQTLFAVVAVLAMAMQKAASVVDHWVPKGFVAAESLRRQLPSLTRETVSPNKFQLNKYFFNLRKEIHAAVCNSDPGDRWDKLFVEHRRSFGFRLSTAPQNIHVHLDDDPRKSDGWSGPLGRE